MAEYLILIYGDEAALDNPEPGSFDQMMKGHQVSVRSTPRRCGGQRAAVDGDGDVGAPGLLRGLRGNRRSVCGDQGGTWGYYLVEAADLDEALAWQSRCPCRWRVEVRPIRTFS